MLTNYEVSVKECRHVVKLAKNAYTIGIVTDYNSALAYCNEYNLQYAQKNIFCAYVLHLIAVNSCTSVLEYLQKYAQFKRWSYETLNDTGALADLFEVLIRVAAKKNFNLVRISDLHVKTAGKHDIILQGVPYEIGSNGKSWTQGTINDYMQGDFTGVIYGMYSTETMYYVIDCISAGDVITAVNTIASNACIFANKYDYLQAIQNLTRGKGITFKPSSNLIQTVYNSGKLQAFINVIGTTEFKCYSDTYHI